ncbi:DNA (cytosine-5)-methyltransferase 1 [Rhizobium sp. BK275]|uniref:DNA cytosine methyltransferase n=1 Tax=Rhizobium sp. BK275 TaxID=2587077 RepID=UPI0016098A69|nr:DNA cytosine methyltransferase [Rhizobium sp. BK275]MBB3391601.1 DNA (cytosine-5)-methyltransferase 1 [Rhizobium sp. BK275]
MPRIDAKIGEVVDLFCGVGALSHGLKKAGFDIKAGYDTDRRCKYAFEKNNNSKFYARDVAKLTADEIRGHFSGTAPSVLAGCAPCQPFSTYKQRYDEDPRWDLVNSFALLAAEVQSDFVTMENVPSLLKYKDGAVFNGFKKILIAAGYNIKWTVAKCEEFGVPQRRRRLVVLAAKNNIPNDLAPTHDRPVSVYEAINNLPAIAAGESSPNDRLHTAASLSDLNIERIRASKPGGTWRDWPFHLRAKCHQKSTGKTYPGVYARMSWNEPSPTMTTQCYGYGNGRFGHPEQDRAISLREAALIQTFPENYEFLPENRAISFSEVGRWIGNAVPVALAEAVGRSISASITEGNDAKQRRT